MSIATVGSHISLENGSIYNTVVNNYKNISYDIPIQIFAGKSKDVYKKKT